MSIQVLTPLYTKFLTPAICPIEPEPKEPMPKNPEGGLMNKLVWLFHTRSASLAPNSLVPRRLEAHLRSLQYTRDRFF